MDDLARNDSVALEALEELLKRRLNPLAKLTWDAVGYELLGSRVVGLSLFGCGLEALPVEIARLDGLRRLNVRRNRICAFPAAFGDMPGLQLVSAERNRLTCIPDLRGSAASLRELYLANNHIEDVENLRHLSKLEILDLDHNGIRSIGDSLADCGALKILNLGSKKIATLADPDVYTPAPLRKYQFPGQPRTPFELQAMIFEQRFNRVAKLESLQALESLEELSIVLNQLSELPENIGRLKNLRLLDASYNQLTALPLSLGSLTRLEVVDVSHNDIAVPPAFISGQTRLDLRGNPAGT
ncbi:leucine-rich repeat domain-containing protein [uncultured Bradyrhizobium sp.]|uniref:leucine-rich repeat domain-containing protein n=1 Tax=uncultured Bradyrhizobium sp. TaxID=199684 RepID=UPI0035CB305C